MKIERQHSLEHVTVRVSIESHTLLGHSALSDRRERVVEEVIEMGKTYARKYEELVVMAAKDKKP